MDKFTAANDIHYIYVNKHFIRRLKLRAASMAFNEITHVSVCMSQVIIVFWMLPLPFIESFDPVSISSEVKQTLDLRLKGKLDEKH